MTSDEQERMSQFIQRAVCELRDRLSERAKRGGTSIPDLSRTTILTLLVDEDSQMFTVMSEQTPMASYLHQLIVDTVDEKNEKLRYERSKSIADGKLVVQ